MNFTIPVYEDYLPTIDVHQAVLARVAADREKKLTKKASKTVGKSASAAAAVEPVAGVLTAGSQEKEAYEEARVRAGPNSIMPPPPIIEGRGEGSASAAAKDPSLVAGTGRKRAALEAEAAAAAAAVGKKNKKALALEVMPKHATQGVYASLFSSSVAQPEKETYCCRSTSARGVHLT